MVSAPIYIGTAGWAVPKTNADDVLPGGSGLARYATVFECTEINSTFKHQHRATTYARWADTTPDAFRFAVKFPKLITHDLRLAGCEVELHDFLSSIAPLGSKLGPLLVQLPPSLTFDAAVVSTFFGKLRTLTHNPIVCEPRHPTWFTPEADSRLASVHVSRAAADPSIAPAPAWPGGNLDFTYLRLHGSPRMYYSAYDEERLVGFAAQVRQASGECWCIFDNTAASAAFGDALQLKRNLKSLS